MKCLLIQHEGWSNCYGVDDLLCKATALFKMGIGRVVVGTHLLSRQSTLAPQLTFNILFLRGNYLKVFWSWSCFFPTEAKYSLTYVSTRCHSAPCTELLYPLGKPWSFFWCNLTTCCVTYCVGYVFLWLLFVIRISTFSYLKCFLKRECEMRCEAGLSF